MQTKPILSKINLAVEEYNKTRLPSEHISKADAEYITKLQFKVIKEFINKPFYPALTISNLFYVQVKLSYIKMILWFLIGYMKKARAKGKEKDYYIAAKSFSYWRILLQKAVPYINTTNPSASKAWAKAAKEKEERRVEKIKNNKVVFKAKLNKKDWDMSHKFISYEDWISTEDYKNNPLQIRPKWNIPLNDKGALVAKEYKLKLIAKKEEYLKMGMIDTSHQRKNYLSEIIKINRRNKIK